MESEDKIKSIENFSDKENVKHKKESGYGLAVDTDSEQQNWQKEWFEKYKGNTDIFLSKENLEELKLIPSEKRIFFLKLAKLNLDIDSDKLGDELALEMEKSKEEMEEEWKKGQGLLKEMADKAGKKLYGKKEYLGERISLCDMSNKIELEDPEFEKANNDESDAIKSILKLEGKDKQQIAFGNNINDIIGNFENSGKSNKDFNLMMEKFDAISWHREIKDAWNQKQVDKLLEIYEENMDNLDPKICRDFFSEVLGRGSVSYLAADSFIRRMESGEKISKLFLEKIGFWAGENLDTMDSGTVSDFLLVLINNSDKIDRSFMSDLFNDFDPDYWESFVSRFSGELYKNNNDVYKTLKNIEVLDYFKHSIDEQYFEQYSVKHNLQLFKQNSDNFFVNFKIDQVLDFFHKAWSWQEKRSCLEAIKEEYDDLRQELPEISSASDERIDRLFEGYKGSIDIYLLEKEDKRRKVIYDDSEIRKSYNAEPAIFEFREYGAKERDQKKDDFCYAKISDKYGIIYAPDGAVDSFFGLQDKDSGDGGDKEKFTSKNLSVSEVLAKEGFRKEDIKESDYKKMVLTYKTLIELPMREKIEKEFGIELKNFNIREQVQFVNFLASKTIQEVEGIKEFLNQGQSSGAKHNRIKSFLSLESGEEMGNKILNIGEKLDTESADAVFAKYAEIIETAEKSRMNLENLFKNKKEISDEDIGKIVQNLLDKGNNFLVSFSERIKKGKNTDKESILKELENYKTDLILTACAYKGISKKEDVNFEDFKGVTFEQKTAEQILSEEKINDLNQMLEIYAKNYEHRPKFRDELLRNFKEKLEKQKDQTRLYIYKKDGTVIAFNRFDDLENGRKYFGSFNVDPAVQDSSVGKGLFKASIEKEAAGGDIEATCDVFSPASIMYIETGKFAAIEVMPEFDKETKTPAFRIKKEKDIRYEYQGKSADEIIGEYKKDFSGNRYEEGQKNIILKFIPNSQELLDSAEKLINEKGYALTRYFCGEDKKDAYCVFEKRRT